MNTDASERKNSRTETIDRIRVALKRRTGHAWSVRGGYSFPFNEREYMIARAEGLNVEDLARPMAANDNGDALASLG